MGAFTMMGNAMNNHKFKVGQTVSYTSKFIATVNAGAIFKITQLLPPEGHEFQYRIRNASEPYERVAKESQLDRAA
jgi:hypothetical protein